MGARAERERQTYSWAGTRPPSCPPALQKDHDPHPGAPSQPAAVAQRGVRVRGRGELLLAGGPGPAGWKTASTAPVCPQSWDL